MKRITKVSELKVGDKIRILSRPREWSAVLNKKCPLYCEFPKEVTIKEMQLISGNSGFTSMTCGEFGWTLDKIIEAGCELITPQINPLPAKWYIKGGSPEIKVLLKCLKSHLNGSNPSAGYYLKEKSQTWVCEFISSLKDFTEITSEEYSNSLNKLPENQTNQINLKETKIMQNTTQKTKERIIATIKDNEIKITTDGTLSIQDTVTKEVTVTRTLKINGVERDLTVSVMVGDEGDLYTGYSIRNPKWDKENNPELAKTVARNRAIHPKTNLTKIESITYKLRNKYVLKGIAEQIFAQVSKGIIEIKGVK